MRKIELTVQDCMKIIGTETKDNKVLILVLGILMVCLLSFLSVFIAIPVAIIVAVLYWSQAKKSKKGDNKKFLIKIDTCVKKKKVETPDSGDFYYIYFMDNGEVKIENVFWRTADNGYKCLYDSVEKTDKCFLLCLESDVNVYAIFPIKDFELKLDEFVEKSGIYYPTI